MKKVKSVHRHNGEHWVGDGFPVKNLFSYSDQTLLKDLSPFLHLDHAGPATFDRAEKPRGVGKHPHRGFETVTIVYAGEVEHQDSAGNGGIIGVGDVQWMTAAAGILHAEFHSAAFTKQGGLLHMAQLWVNLPSKDKTCQPGYQTLPSSSIPVVELPQSAGQLRVIAGEYDTLQGPATTFTPMNVWDIRLNAGATVSLATPDGDNSLLVVMQGNITLNKSEKANENMLVVFEREGSNIELHAESDALLLFLGGEPIDEPVAAHGPFVMNTQDEIQQAINDYQQGRF